MFDMFERHVPQPVDHLPERYFMVKITLLRSYPKSWRNVCIPSDLDALTFMDVINRLFGWEGFDHLFDFKGLEDLVYELGRESKGEITVSELFQYLGTKLTYVYDFGDYHEHTVELKDASFAPESGHYPIYCIKSKGGHGIEDGTCVDWTEDDYDIVFDEDGNYKLEHDEALAFMEKCAARVDATTVNFDLFHLNQALYDGELQVGDPCVVPSKAELQAQKKAEKEQQKAERAKARAEQKAKEKAQKEAEKAKASTKPKVTKRKTLKDKA